MSHHTLKDAITRAIYAEIGATNFYARMAEKIENEEGSGKFAQLSEDEKGHRDTLKGWYSRLFREKIAQKLFEIANSENIRTQMSRRGRFLVDGKGLERVLKELTVK